MNSAKDLKMILKLLKTAYGPPRRFVASDPVDELIRTILSQNTNDRNSLAAFSVLKKHFRIWDSALRATEGRIAQLIKHAGLANIKARRIREVLSEIKRREGAIDLSVLKSAEPASSIAYLRSLKGVGPKTAACVLLFSFAKPVMPVDTHIFRVAGRLRLIAEKAGIEEAHERLTGLSGKNPGLIYELHLCIIEHGRRTCKAQNPRCGFCALYDMCRFKYKRRYRGLPS